MRLPRQKMPVVRYSRCQIAWGGVGLSDSITCTKPTDGKGTYDGIGDDSTVGTPPTGKKTLYVYRGGEGTGKEGEGRYAVSCTATFGRADAVTGSVYCNPSATRTCIDTKAGTTRKA